MRKVRTAEILSLPAQESLRRVGECIRIARKKRNITIASLATRVAADEKTIGNLEKGNPGVSIAILIAVMDILGLPPLEEHLSPENDQYGLSLDKLKLLKGKSREKKIDINF